VSTGKCSESARGHRRRSNIANAAEGHADAHGGKHGCTPEEAVLPAKNALKVINLANNCLDDEGAGLLASVMHLFGSLEALLLYNNAEIGLGCELGVAAPLEKGSTICLSTTPSSPRGFPTSQRRKGLIPNVRRRSTPPSSSHGSSMSALAETMSHPSDTRRSEQALPTGLLLLIRALPHSLVRLSLGSCHLGDFGASEVCKALTDRPTFSDLDLSDNDIVADHIFSGALTRLLRTPADLKKLCLALNSIGDIMVVEIARTLSSYNHQVVVDLSANKVSDEMRAVINNYMRADGFENSLSDAQRVAAGVQADGVPCHSMEHLAFLARELVAAPHRLAGRLQV